jgi:hypothetical protein
LTGCCEKYRVEGEEPSYSAPSEEEAAPPEADTHLRPEEHQPDLLEVPDWQFTAYIQKILAILLNRLEDNSCNNFRFLGMVLQMFQYSEGDNIT